MPWDISSAQLVSAVHERLVADTRGQPLEVIPHAEFMRYVQAAGFESSRALKPADVKAISQLARADLVVAVEIAPCNLAAGRCEVHPEENRLHVQASTIDPGEGVLVRIMDGNGSIASIADVLVRALHNVPAYKRLLSQSGATSELPARYLVDSTGRLVAFYFRSTTNAFKWRFNIDSAFRVYRSPSLAINWKARYVIDTANSKFSFRFLQRANPFFTRFSFDSTGRVNRFRPPPIG